MRFHLTTVNMLIKVDLVSPADKTSPRLPRLQVS